MTVHCTVWLSNSFLQKDLRIIDNKTKVESVQLGKWSKKNLGLKKFWVQNFFVVVLVLLVTWTPNPLNSA